MTHGVPLRPKSERGASIVEFALVAPVFIMLLMGTVSAGAIYNSKMNLTYAAREGTRYASTHALSDTNWATTVATIVVARSGGDLALSNVCVSLVTGSGAATQVYEGNTAYSTTGSPCIASDGNTDGMARIQVKVTRTATLQAAVLSIPVALNSSAVGLYES
jgi:Flp pilus assembly protein TadG